MKRVISWPYFDPDYENLTERIYGPPCRVSIDNESMHDCTVIKVDSVNKQGLLLEVVQVLTDMNLQISKSYISCDGGWFMDVFHVKDEHGNKLRDQRVINYIQQATGSKREVQRPPTAEAKAIESKNSVVKSGDPDHNNEHTAIEMTGTDRPGLFSEISAALRDLHCNIVEAHAWSHNAHLACVAYISDQCTDTPIDDPDRLATIEDHLNMVLRAPTISTTTHQTPPHTQQEVKTSGGLHAHGGEGRSMISNMERRLHQLMLSVRDFDEPLSQPSSIRPPNSNGGDGENPEVSIEECDERGYSIVNIKCKDRPRLMFDTVCTLTDLQYVIFHASITSCGAYSYQEYFIRHIDGCALSTASEKERVVKCIEAAIERRVCEGLRLELCANNRIGLLSDITRVLRENGLAVVRADVATEGEKAVNAFYVRDISGNKVNMDCFMECVKKEMGPVKLAVKNYTHTPTPTPTPTPTSQHEDKPSSPSNYSFGEKLKSRIIGRLSHNFITTDQ